MKLFKLFLLTTLIVSTSYSLAQDETVDKPVLKTPDPNMEKNSSNSTEASPGPSALGADGCPDGHCRNFAITVAPNKNTVSTTSSRPGHIGTDSSDAVK